jgi:PKD repeat protein
LLDSRRSSVIAALGSIFAAIGLAAAVAPAGAVVVNTRQGIAVSYLPVASQSGSRASGLARAARPFDTFFTNLDYGGGPVMTSNTNYTIFWRPSGAGVTAYPAAYQSGLNTFFEDLAHDSGGNESVESVATQYNDAEGAFVKYDSHFGGTFVDEDPYPASGCPYAVRCFTDEQLREELQSFVKAHGLPTDLSHEYFLLTPPGVESCFVVESGFECSAGTPEEVAAYCAYHSNIPLPGGGEIIYANDPYVTGNEGCDDGDHPNGLPSDGAIQGGLSHEHNESVTDPEPNSAWTDWGQSATGEDGDKCRTSEPASEFGTPLGEVTVGGQKMAYNQEINGHKYWYQQEWSNKGHTCLQRLTFNSSEAPNTSFTSTFEGGSTVAFDAAGSTSGAGVRYAWQFNDAGGAHENNTIETESPTIVHEFPSAGEYRMALTVFKPDGTSIGAAHDVLVDEPPTASFSVTTPSPSAGSPVSFDGSASSDPDGFIASYAWSFGDGATAAGSSPSHTFAAPGTYEVTLTVTDDLGVSASVTHALLVAPTPPPSGGGGGGSVGTGGTTSTTPIAPAPATVIASVAHAALSTLTTAVSAKTGAIAITTSVNGPGTLRWVATFPNGRFGAFTSASRCKRDRLRLAGRCLPASIVFSKGSKPTVAPGDASVTLKPTASGLKALRNALKHGRGVSVTIALVFHPSTGSPVSRTLSLNVTLK